MLGAAWIAGVALLPAIDRSRNGRVVALASRSGERAREMLAPHPGAQVVDSYDALLERKDVDAVYIPLVNNLHLTWTLRALAAGKHVLCEKPLAMNAIEATQMSAAAGRAGRLLMEAFMYRFDPRVRDFVSGLSDPIHVEASFGFTLDDLDNYRLDPALGGGALLDVGCYGVSVSRWILGEPVDVQARARFGHGVDMTTSVLVDFDEGKAASVFASFESAEHQEVKVIGRVGVERLERPFNRLIDPIEPYRLMVESFGNSIVEGRPVEIPVSESIANMETLDRVRAAFTRLP